MGPAGITGADTIRLNLVAVPRASLLPLSSTVALAQNTFSLLPAQSAALEFSNAALAVGTRQMVLPSVER